MNEALASRARAPLALFFAHDEAGRADLKRVPVCVGFYNITKPLNNPFVT